MNIKIYTKRIIFFLIAQIFIVDAFAQSAEIKQAEEAYTKEDYRGAIEIYEKVLKTHGESAAIYYNLGNAYYKSNQIAQAILNYERALLINPNDADARFNLQMARQKTIDKIEPAGDFFLAKWINSIQNSLGTNAWGTVGIVCFILLICCCVLFFFSKWIYLKKIGFYAGGLLIIVIILANVFGQHQKDKLYHRNSAIVLTPTVTVKSSPDNSGTDLFILHEGTKVNINSKLGEWSEIKMEDGSVGWLPNKDFQII